MAIAHPLCVSECCAARPGTGVYCVLRDLVSKSQPADRRQGHSSSWYIRVLGVAYMDDGFQYPQSALIMAQSALIPGCNGLSQFKEDTGEPSIPVRTLNLLARPLVQSSGKPPFRSGFEPRTASPEVL